MKGIVWVGGAVGVLCVAGMMLSAFKSIRADLAPPASASVGGTAPEPTPVVASVSTQAVTQTDASADGSATAEPVQPLPTNCHDNEMAQRMLASGKNSQTRSNFAATVARTLPNDDISIYTMGEDHEHLMFVTQEQNEAELRNLITAVGHDVKAHVTLCEQGFTDEQFILKGDGGRQRLLLKVPSSYAETIHQEMRDVASPM